MAVETEHLPSPAPGPNTEQITFTEKEQRVLMVAWHCLKSGPPDIDLEKLTELAGFQTQKTCSNTWGVIKKKLGVAPASAKKTAAGGGGSAKGKRTKDEVDGDGEVGEDGPATPTKKRKARAKKSPVKTEVKDEVDEDFADFN
ncbi:hypothetical protein MBLNU457_1742t1 [Dothideomycetes sp. NU457]